MHFILGGEPGKPPSSLLAAPEAWFHRSFPLRSHRHTNAIRQSQPYTLVPSLMAQRKSDGGREPMVPAGGRWQPPPENPTLEAKNEAGVIWCRSGLCRCLSPSLPSILSQVECLPSGGQDSTSTRMGIGGFSHGSPTAILLCSKLTLTLLPLRQLPAAHSNFCSLIFIFQSATGSWTSEQRGLDAEVADTSGACLFPWQG